MLRQCSAHCPRLSVIRSIVTLLIGSTMTASLRGPGCGPPRVELEGVAAEVDRVPHHRGVVDHQTDPFAAADRGA